MAVVSIQYDEGKKKNLNYKSVQLSYNWGEDKKLFNTGNFVKDWYDCIKFMIMNINDEPVSHSSSVNHFIMDGAKFDSAYLVTDLNEKTILRYGYLSSTPGIEFFVEQGTTPTWEELKAMCE